MQSHMLFEHTTLEIQQDLECSKNLALLECEVLQTSQALTKYKVVLVTFGANFVVMNFTLYKLD